MGIYYVSGVPFGDELYHHGIKGQKWGIRRFQNPDGTLTAAGRERYNQEDDKAYVYNKRGERVYDTSKAQQAYESTRNSLSKKSYETVEQEWSSTLNDIYDSNYQQLPKKEQEKIKAGNERINQLMGERSEIFSSIRSEEAAKRTPSVLRQIFESDKAVRNRNDEIHKAATERANKNDDYKRINKEIAEISAKLAKTKNRYRDVSMQKILNKLPKEDRENAWILMKYYWHDYD